jgi:hypothetical protein
VWLQLTAKAPTAACPRCAVPSSSIHSRYHRHPPGLHWGTYTVRIQLTVRKFACRHATCMRRIFTERLPDLLATDARKTRRLITALLAIGMDLGGTQEPCSPPACGSRPVRPPCSPWNRGLRSCLCQPCKWSG